RLDPERVRLLQRAVHVQTRARQHPQDLPRHHCRAAEVLERAWYGPHDRDAADGHLCTKSSVRGNGKKRKTGRSLRAARSIMAHLIMDLSGLEPLTPWLQTRCSPS